MTEIQEIIHTLVQFRDQRDWKQFHNSKNLAVAISIEAAELNELFLWKDVTESENVDKNKIKDELADILAFSFLLAEKHGFDVKEIMLEKIRKNGEKYPVDKAKGTAKKYDELGVIVGNDLRFNEETGEFYTDPKNTKTPKEKRE